MNDQICSYIFLRNSTYYFSRRIPLDMKGHYSSKRIVKSLKTRLRRVALRSSNHINFQLETYWSSIRVEQITQTLISNPFSRTDPALTGCGYDLLDVKEHYLRFYGVKVLDPMVIRLFKSIWAWQYFGTYQNILYGLRY